MWLFKLIADAVEGLALPAGAGYELVVVTNQAGIARGLYGEVDYRALTAHMLSALAPAEVQVSGVYHCPHHPDAMVAHLRVKCDCRKPRPGVPLAWARTSSFVRDTT